MMLTAACAQPRLPDREPGLEGTVLRRDTAYNLPIQRPTMFVRGEDDPCGIIFVVDEDTEVLRRRDGKLVKGSEGDALVGTRVRVWYSGVAESCPGQSHAEVVEVLDG
jgi:hypothetical protein